MFEYWGDGLDLGAGAGHLEHEFRGFSVLSFSSYGCLLCVEFMKFGMVVIVHDLLFFVLGFKIGCLFFMWNNYLLKLLCKFNAPC